MTAVRADRSRSVKGLHARERDRPAASDADRPTGDPRPAWVPPMAARIRVGIIGATGYVGGELVRLLARHPNVELVGLVGRDRDHDPIGGIHPHLATPA